MDDLTLSGDPHTVEEDVLAIMGSVSETARPSSQPSQMRDHHGGLFAYLYVTGIRPVYQGREREHDAAWSLCCQSQGLGRSHPAENRGAGQSYETTLPVACTRLAGAIGLQQKTSDDRTWYDGVVAR